MGRMTKADDNARYQELLEVAPPESLELVHEEAFGKLTPRATRRDVHGPHRLGGHPRAEARRCVTRGARRSGRASGG